MERDTISIDTAGEIDRQWVNSGMPDNGLRIVNHYASGNRTVSILEVPGDDSTPVYRRVNNHYEHVAGPTLAEWQERLHFNAVDLRNEQTYRRLAQDCIEGARIATPEFQEWAIQDAELFNERADFYAQRAASR